MPYICKRSNSTRKTQPPDLPPTALGGCPSGWNQFLNKVGGGAAKGVRGEDVIMGRPSLRSPGRLAVSKSRPW